ncbi:hypothetical protein MT418_002994 [Batrachochytrium dendrobatidis]
MLFPLCMHIILLLAAVTGDVVYRLYARVPLGRAHYALNTALVDPIVYGSEGSKSQSGSLSE